MVGDQIRKMRKSRGWSQEELAEKMNTSRQSVSRWEDGSVSPSASSISELCRVFQVSANYFFDEEAADSKSVPVESVSEEHQEKKMASRAIQGKWLTIISAISFVILLIYCSVNDAEYEIINIDGYTEHDFTGILGSLLYYHLLWLAILLMVLMIAGCVLWFGSNKKRK